MGREIKRVPLNFGFPLDESYHAHCHMKHRETCSDEDCEHEVSYEPPAGEGWQLWQTVSDGPISPVFDTPEKLIDWMSQPVPANKRPSYEPAPFPRMPWGQGWRRETAEKFVRGKGWMPSGLMVDGRMLSGDEIVSDLEPRK